MCDSALLNHITFPSQGTVADGAPVVPISAQLKYNIDVVCEYIVKKIPIPERNFISPPNMIVIRSFDVNKPGFEVDEIKGGVAGGSILRVSFYVYDMLDVVPVLILCLKFFIPSQLIYWNNLRLFQMLVVS